MKNKYTSLKEFCEEMVNSTLNKFEIADFNDDKLSVFVSKQKFEDLWKSVTLSIS